MRNKHFKITVFILSIVLLAADTWACDGHINGEFWVGKERLIGGADLTLLSCNTWYSGTRLGVSVFGDGEHGYSGATGSVRLQFGHIVMPYVGVGVLLGMANYNEDAGSDGLDNDGDGLIDEFGEKNKVSDGGGLGFPEAGVAVCINHFGLTLSARQFYGVGPNHAVFNGDIIYGVGIGLCGKE